MDYTKSLKNGAHSAFSYTCNTLKPYYHSIPGDNLREKTTTVALKTLATVVLISLAFIYYPHVTKKIRHGSLSWTLFSTIPLIGPSFLCVNYQKAFVEAIKTWKGHSSWSQRLIAIATIYVLFGLMTRTALSLGKSIPGGPKEPTQRTFKPLNPSQTEHSVDLSSLVKTLDDSGLTNGDYAALDLLFKFGKQHHPSLQERVACHLSNQGLCNQQDLIDWGIVSPTSNRQTVMQNLLTYLKADQSEREKTSKMCSLRTIEKTQRVATATFNLLLTLGTLALQLKYSFRSTLIGVGLGVLLKSDFISYSFKKTAQMINQLIIDQLKLMMKHFGYEYGDSGDDKHPPSVIFVKQNGIHSLFKLADLYLISWQSQKTALTSPTTTVHKCRQIWESWHLLAHSIVPTAGPLSVIGGIVQGQTLASYWKSLYGKRVSPSPN